MDGITEEYRFSFVFRERTFQGLPGVPLGLAREVEHAGPVTSTPIVQRKIGNS